MRLCPEEGGRMRPEKGVSPNDVLMSPNEFLGITRDDPHPRQQTSALFGVALQGGDGDGVALSERQSLNLENSLEPRKRIFYIMHVH